MPGLLPNLVFGTAGGLGKSLAQRAKDLRAERLAEWKFQRNKELQEKDRKVEELEKRLEKIEAALSQQL